MTSAQRAELRASTTSSSINTRQIQDYLTSGEAENMQLEGTAPSQEVVTFFDLDKAVITDHAGLTGVGTHTHMQIDTHLTSTSNPHGVTWQDTGASVNTHGHTLSHISDWPTSFPPEDHTHDGIYYNQILFRDYSAGTVDSGKPVRLDANGKISSSMIDVSNFQPQGNWDPSMDNSGEGEYPDGATPGQFWIIHDIANQDGTTGEGLPYYTFTGGGLSTSNITTQDILIKTEALDPLDPTDVGWAIKNAGDYKAYYVLDGSVAITGPFAGGGQQFKNVADGADPQDAVTYNQLVAVDNNKASTNHTHSVNEITDLQDTLDDVVMSVVPTSEPGEQVLNFIVMTKAEYTTITPQPGTVYGLKD